MKYLQTVLVISSLLLFSQAAQSDTNGDQQQKDLEQKQRIYGNKYPWENTAPYGTQYTPPQSGAGSVAPEENNAAAKPAKATAKSKGSHHQKAKRSHKKPTSAKTEKEKSASAK